MPRELPTTVDEVAVRTVATIVGLTALLTLVTGQWWLLGLLAIDFTLRSTLGPKASPIARLVCGHIRPRLSAAPKPTAWAPKRFAASLGAGMTVTATLLVAVATAFDQPALLTVVAGITVVMVALPALEAIFAYCVGCKVYGILMRRGLLGDTACIDCGPVVGATSAPPGTTRTRVAEPA